MDISQASQGIPDVALGPSHPPVHVEMHSGTWISNKFVIPFSNGSFQTSSEFQFRLSSPDPRAPLMRFRDPGHSPEAPVKFQAVSQVLLSPSLRPEAAAELQKTSRIRTTLSLNIKCS